MTRPIIEEVRRRLATGTGPVTGAALAALVRAEGGGLLGDDRLLQVLRDAEDELHGAGALAVLLRDPTVTDVLVNSPGEVWVDRGDGLTRASVTFADEDAVRRLASRLATAAGRRLDDACPWVDAVLVDGTRLHAVLPPIAPAGTCLSLRAFRPRAFSVADLLSSGTLDAEAVMLVHAVVRRRLAFLVSGGTGSGKTTLLSTLLGLVDPGERVLIVEDASELRPEHPHVVRLAARASNVEGAGEVTLRDLVRQAMRMRPDRIVVGEVRGAEVVDLLTALNTGHDGGAGTVHANSPSEVPARLEALGALGGLGPAAVHSQLAAALDVVLHLRRDPVRGRYLDEIGVVRVLAGRVDVVPGWRRSGERCPAREELASLVGGL